MTTNQPGDAEQPWGAEQPSPAEPPQQQWGAPPPPASPQRPRWSGKKTAAAVAIAVAIAAGGGAAIYAATANDSGTQQGGGPGFGGPGGPNGGMGGPRMGAASIAEALHGEFVVADGSTELLQNGQVTSINDTSVAVKSTDGYTKTYTIDSSTVKDGDIQTGDQVVVIAKEAGTAISVSEPSAMQQRGDGRQQQPPAAR